mmetsp:Transcript_37259/g.79093  ORF Transcript_37259/g.79093 Transcript_37259/m.79093 type:complete len:329 (-) Transcript_37259:92-1078(-)
MSMLKYPVIALMGSLSTVWIQMGRQQRIIDEETKKTVEMVDADRRILGDRLDMMKQRLEASQQRVQELELALGETPTVTTWNEEHEQLLEQRVREVEESLVTPSKVDKETQGDAFILLVQSVLELQSLSQDLWHFFASQLISTLWPLDLPTPSTASGGKREEDQSLGQLLTDKASSALAPVKEAVSFAAGKAYSPLFCLWSALNSDVKASLQAFYLSACQHVETLRSLVVAVVQYAEASLDRCMQNFAAHSPEHRPTIAGHSAVVVLAGVHLYLLLEAWLVASCLGLVWRTSKACCRRKPKRRVTGKDYHKWAAKKWAESHSGRVGGA